MARVTRILVAYTAVLFCAALVAAYLLGAFDGPIHRLRLRAHHDAYLAAAEAVVAAERGRAPDGDFRRHELDDIRRKLVTGTRAYYLRRQGTDYVYFPLEDVVTLSGGLMYSSTGARPPETSCISVSDQFEAHWYYVGFNNATLQAGYLIP